MSGGPGLLLRAMSGSVAFSQPGAVLLSIAHDTIEGYANAIGLGHNLGLCWCLRVMLPWGL